MRLSDLDAATDGLNENEIAGTLIGITAFADDLDGTDTVTYALDNDAGGRFAIDSLTGVVTSIISLDAETAVNHLITIRATSTDGSFSTQSYSISVNDVDEFDVGAVIDVDGSVNSLVENSASGTIAGITSWANDGDISDSVTFSLDDDAGGRFQIDSISGVITSTQPFDFESQSSYAITIRATSSDSSTSTQNFNILIGDANEQPAAIGEHFVVDQFDALNIVTGGVLQNDSDIDGNVLSVVLVSGPANGILHMNLDGTFQYVPNEDFFGTDTFSYSASDGNLQSDPIQVTITVLPASTGTPVNPNTFAPTISKTSSTEDNDETLEELTTEADLQLVDELIATAIRKDSKLRSTSDESTENASELIPLLDDQDELAVASVIDANSASHSYLRYRRLRDSSTENNIETNFMPSLHSMTNYVLSLGSWTDSSESHRYHETTTTELIIGTSAIVSTSLSVGYVIWLLRSGTLLMTFLTSIPAWCAFDPLPIIESMDETEDDQDDESLVSMVTSNENKREAST